MKNSGGIFVFPFFYPYYMYGPMPYSYQYYYWYKLPRSNDPDDLTDDDKYMYRCSEADDREYDPNNPNNPNFMPDTPPNPGHILRFIQFNNKDLINSMLSYGMPLSKALVVLRTTIDTTISFFNPMPV